MDKKERIENEKSQLYAARQIAEAEKVTTYCDNISKIILRNLPNLDDWMQKCPKELEGLLEEYIRTDVANNADKPINGVIACSTMDLLIDLSSYAELNGVDLNQFKVTDIFNLIFVIQSVRSKIIYGF